MTSFTRTGSKSLLGALLATLSFFAAATELPPGTVIDKTNLDKVKTDTFEGKTIASMLQERVEWQIRNYNLKIKLRKYEKLALDPHIIEATKKYSSNIKFDPKTREVTGFQAGIAFPNIDPADPFAGDKIIWNQYYAPTAGQMHEFGPEHFVFIDGKKGIERTQEWVYLRYFMKNRVMESKPIEGEGKEFSRTLLYALDPYDIKGIGTYTVRYDTPEYESVWAYFKSARRLRQLSGNAWMDPIGGTDFLNDDIEIFNARPSWYKSIKLMGKRWVLGVAHSKFPVEDEKQTGNKRFSRIDFENAPYWNPVEEWEPREVYVLEAIPPESHPYSKKIVYMDVEVPRTLFGETYDRNGQFWKALQFAGAPVKGPDGFAGILSTWGNVIDFKRMHATWFTTSSKVVINKQIKSAEVTMSKLEEAASN